MNIWLIQLLRPTPGKLLLDISCGEGRLVALARELDLHAIGLDFAWDGVLKGAQSAPGAGWAVADGELIPIADGSVDLVTHIGSLEHYLDPAQGAREIARVLKSTGKACILLPNAYGLLGNVLHVLAKGEIFDDGQPIQRYATRKTWEALLSQGGLKIDKTIGYGEIIFPRTWQDFKSYLGNPRRILRHFLSQFIPVNLTNQFVFLCSKA